MKNEPQALERSAKMKLLCQKCGRSDATVHRESMMFGQKIEEHLCGLCAGTGAEALNALEVSIARRKLKEITGGNPQRTFSFLKSDSFAPLMERLFTPEERKRVFVEISERGYRIHGDVLLLKRLFAALCEV